MNIQRTNSYLNNVIRKYRKNTKTTETEAEILYYQYEQIIFIFDPQEFKNEKIATSEIKSYYEKVVENVMKDIEDTPFLEMTVCDYDSGT